MPRHLFTTYAMLPRGGSGVPPPPPPPLPPRPQELAPPQGKEEEDSNEEEFLAQLPSDAEAEEATVEQRAILASFETQRHDQSAQELMSAERWAATARLAEDHAVDRADAHRRNIEAARAAMAAAERRLFQADMTGGLATVVAERQRCKHQYPVPVFDASAQREEERRTFTSFLEDAERHRRERVSKESRRRLGMVSRRRSDDGAGRPTLCRHHHRAHQEPCPIPKSAPPPSQNGLKIACAGRCLAGRGRGGTDEWRCS
jgi:hypothetical protein